MKKFALGALALTLSAGLVGTAIPAQADAIALPVIEQDGTQYVPVFTSAEAMVAAGADPEQAAQLTFAQLGAGWPSDELWMAVDPSTPEALTLLEGVLGQAALPAPAAGPDRAELALLEPARAITPGQSGVLYSEAGQVLGGGVIAG